MSSELSTRCRSGYKLDGFFTYLTDWERNEVMLTSQIIGTKILLQKEE